jgi:seryl-tRNA synthetase
MVSLIENYQTDAGTIEVPDILRKYMGDIREIKPSKSLKVPTEQ